MQEDLLDFSPNTGATLAEAFYPAASHVDGPIIVNGEVMLRGAEMGLLQASNANAYQALQESLGTDPRTVICRAIAFFCHARLEELKTQLDAMFPDQNLRSYLTDVNVETMRSPPPLFPSSQYSWLAFEQILQVFVQCILVSRTDANAWRSPNLDEFATKVTCRYVGFAQRLFEDNDLTHRVCALLRGPIWTQKVKKCLSRAKQELIKQIAPPFPDLSRSSLLTTLPESLRTHGTSSTTPAEFAADWQLLLNDDDERDLLSSQILAEEAFQASRDGFLERVVSVETVCFKAIALVCHANLDEIREFVQEGEPLPIDFPGYAELFAASGAPWQPDQKSRDAFYGALRVLRRLEERRESQLFGSEANLAVLRVVRNYVACRFVGFRCVLTRTSVKELIQIYQVFAPQSKRDERDRLRNAYIKLVPDEVRSQWDWWAT